MDLDKYYDEFILYKVRNNEDGKSEGRIEDHRRISVKKIIRSHEL